MQQSDAMVQLTSALSHATKYGYAGWFSEINAALGFNPDSPDAIALWPTAENIKTADSRVDESRHWLGLFDALLVESVKHHTARQYAAAMVLWHKSLTRKQRTMPGTWREPSYPTATLVAEIAHACELLADRYDDTMPGATVSEKRSNFLAYESSLTVERDARRKARDTWANLSCPRRHRGKGQPSVPRIIQQLRQK